MAKKLSSGMKILIGIGIFLLIIVLWFVGSYNGLIKSSAEVEESWANVQTQYQRRADLIPNLVESVQVDVAVSYMKTVASLIVFPEVSFTRTF